MKLVLLQRQGQQQHSAFAPFIKKSKNGRHFQQTFHSKFKNISRNSFSLVVYWVENVWNLLSLLHFRVFVCASIYSFIHCIKPVRIWEKERKRGAIPSSEFHLVCTTRLVLLGNLHIKVLLYAVFEWSRSRRHLNGAREYFIVWPWLLSNAC